MKGITAAAVRLIRAAQRISTKKWTFLGVFAIVFLASVSVLAELDLLPEVSSQSAELAMAAEVEQVVAPVVVATTPELPEKIDIPSIALAVTIENPTTTAISVLDELLHQGAVRYPTSAKLGEEGNVVLFGHSSYLPIVNNAAFKAFNGIQKLKAGDVITVYSSETVYTYAVRTVAKESADEGAIALNVSGKVLTLATCNSFGQKSDRFVVTADFVESHSISK